MQATVSAVGKSAAAAYTDARAGQCPAFHLAGEEFGVRVLKVGEIMGVQDITAVPHTPPYVKGVMCKAPAAPGAWVWSSTASPKSSTWRRGIWKPPPECGAGMAGQYLLDIDRVLSIPDLSGINTLFQ